MQEHESTVHRGNLTGRDEVARIQLRQLCMQPHEVIEAARDRCRAILILLKRRCARDLVNHKRVHAAALLAGIRNLHFKRGWLLEVWTSQPS